MKSILWKLLFGILRSTAVTCIQFLGVDFNLWDIYVCSLKSPFRKYLLPALDVMWKNLDCIHQHEDLNLVRYIHFATISIYVSNFWSQFQPLRDICLLPLESLQKVFALHIWLTTHTIEEMGKLQLAFMMILVFMNWQKWFYTRSSKKFEKRLSPKRAAL